MTPEKIGAIVGLIICAIRYMAVSAFFTWLFLTAFGLAGAAY